MLQQAPSGGPLEPGTLKTADTSTDCTEPTDPTGLTDLSEDARPSSTMETKESVAAAPARGLRFWAIVAALAASKLMLALEITIVSTALPTIVHTLGMGSSYVWVSNGAALASAAIAPPLGQLSDLFGRRHPTCLSVLLFVIGGIISGAAASGPQLIAGRVVQGLGAGGINVMSAIVVSDLVSVRHRGKYMAVMLTAYLLGAVSGPLLGGVLVQAGAWRWVFWLPVPFGVVSFLVLAFFLKGKVRDADSSRRERLRRVDYGGNVVLTAATGSMLYAVTYGGSEYLWSDARIIASLTAGVLGLGLFLLLERHLSRRSSSNNAVEPVMPLRLLNHREGATVAAGAFASSLLSNWANFLLPVYFQGVRMSTPSRAGVQLLPIVAVAVPASIVSVVLVSKLGRYKVLHVAGFAGMCVACGLFSILDAASGDEEWILMEVLFSLGLGMVINTLLPAFQGAVGESDQAVATSTFTFVQSLANIWSVTMPASIFNNRFGALAGRISDEQVRAQLGGGRAYGFATRAFLEGLQEKARVEVVDVFGEAVSGVWYVAAGIAGVAALLACAEGEVVLREKLETDFALEEKVGGEVKVDERSSSK
ncbi:Major facilitator superfamily transporter [Colletotrichum higginsianum IMI 349063]|uniref:Major facilitator superfamily transporter n=2 Tax=Colletotrichum higginsianum (strain IMI 349063) TaxID=759273 RepID=A0A1B7XTF7_COLHI|nr:Major facilitator superfamily transporter [Colletotrichum higginsianum IMI 349063]OBR03047.1 Major facilitator superfamily transporter [Colletotrichum higginsianum IMI 349063]GJD05058.1 major facilitator superfamily transporter [Colletotrichum higginsianum]